MIDQSELPKDIKHKKRYHVHTCIQAFGHNLESGHPKCAKGLLQQTIYKATCERLNNLP